MRSARPRRRAVRAKAARAPPTRGSAPPRASGADACKRWSAVRAAPTCSTSRADGRAGVPRNGYTRRARRAPSPRMSTGPAASRRATCSPVTCSSGHQSMPSRRRARSTTESPPPRNATRRASRREDGAARDVDEIRRHLGREVQLVGPGLVVVVARNEMHRPREPQAAPLRQDTSTGWVESQVARTGSTAPTSCRKALTIRH